VGGGRFWWRMVWADVVQKTPLSGGRRGGIFGHVFTPPSKRAAGETCEYWTLCEARRTAAGPRQQVRVP